MPYMWHSLVHSKKTEFLDIYLCALKETVHFKLLD